MSKGQNCQGSVCAFLIGAALFVCTLLYGGSQSTVAQEFESPELMGLWLPETYFPEGFTLSPYASPTSDNPLRSNGSQAIEFYIAAPGRDRRQEWLTVFIDAMALHRSKEQAELYIQHWNENTSKLVMVPGIADEAHADADYVGDDGSLCRSFSIDSPGPEGVQVHMRKLLLRYVRVDRLNFAIRVNSHRVQGLRKIGNNTEWYTVADPLPCERHLEIAHVFTDRIRAYAVDQGWFEEKGGRAGGKEIIYGLPSSGDSTDLTFDGNSVLPGVIGITGLAAGGIAGLGAWLMLGQTGVGRREAFDGLGDALRGKWPGDGFEAWKSKHEAMGWEYREEDGVAWFEPPPGYQHIVEVAQPELTTHRDGDVNPDTNEVWSDEDGGWVGRNLYEQEKARADHIAQVEARSDVAISDWDAETLALDQSIAASARDRQARAAADEAARERIAAKLKAFVEREGGDTSEIDALNAAGDRIELEDRYEQAIRERMAKTSAEAEVWQRHERLLHAGELASKAVLAGAKAGMMTVAGPVGYIPAAIGSGVLRSAEEGASAWVASSGDKAQLGTALVSGFFAGAKDGVVGRFTSLPRTGEATKIVLPAAADAAETYVRTGDAGQAATTALFSGAGGLAGSKLDAAGSVLAREAGQAGMGTAMGAAGAVINGGSIGEGALNGLAEAVGGRVGQHLGSANVPMTADEIRMDLEHAAKVADARERIDTLKAAVATGDEASVKAALNDVLDHREAKLILKDDAGDPDFAKVYCELTQTHRTQPVFEGAAQALNVQTVKGADGTDVPRFVVRDAAGNERPVAAGDFASGSGDPTKPGVDLDMYPKETIIDRSTGRPAKAADLDAAITKGCEQAGIDRGAQEVTLTGVKGTDDWVMGTGEVPKDFIARAQTEGKVTAAEGTSIAEVSRAKLAEADALHGVGSSSTVSEHARSIMKDQDRLVDHLIAGDAKAQVPEVFRRADAVTGETPLTILKKVADGTMPPGTGNAQFRRLTGMDITEATPKLASWGEALGKWSAGESGGTSAGPSITGSGLGANLQQTAASILKDAADKGGGT